MTAIARRVLALVAAGACVFAWDGYAQNYPLKTIALSCRSSPAGDRHPGALAQQLNTAFGQPVIVENRGGAGGVPGTEAVVRARPMATRCSRAIRGR